MDRTVGAEQPARLTRGAFERARISGRVPAPSRQAEEGMRAADGHAVDVRIQMEDDAAFKPGTPYLIGAPSSPPRPSSGRSPASSRHSLRDGRPHANSSRRHNSARQLRRRTRHSRPRRRAGAARSAAAVAGALRQRRPAAARGAGGGRPASRVRLHRHFHGALRARAVDVAGPAPGVAHRDLASSHRCASSLPLATKVPHTDIVWSGARARRYLVGDTLSCVTAVRLV